MDNFLERKAAQNAQREATQTDSRKEKRQKSCEKEGGSREGPEGRKLDMEEEKQ